MSLSAEKQVMKAKAMSYGDYYALCPSCSHENTLEHAIAMHGGVIDCGNEDCLIQIDVEGQTD